MKLPIIIVAPHAQSEIKNKDIRKRIALSDYEIWKCSDPYTGKLKEFTCAAFKHKARVHRLICDFNRGPFLHTAFHEKDFFGRTVFKKDKSFTDKEKAQFLQQYWWPFHEKIQESIKKLEKRRKKMILLVDYHNTSGDHPLNARREYMPGFVISNRGAIRTGEMTKRTKVTLPAKDLKYFQYVMCQELGMPVELNSIFRGGYNLTWYKHLDLSHTKAKIFAVQIEYNLNLVVNPISRRTDEKALIIMQQGINAALIKLYKHLKKSYT